MEKGLTMEVAIKGIDKATKTAEKLVQVLEKARSLAGDLAQDLDAIELELKV